MSRKGIANKKTAEDFFKRCKKLDHDPIEFNILVAKGDWEALGYDRRTYTEFNKFGDEVEIDNIMLADRLAANNKLLEFMYPKRKAIELDTGDDQPKAFVLGYNIDGLVESASQANVLQLNPAEREVSTDVRTTT